MTKNVDVQEVQFDNSIWDELENDGKIIKMNKSFDPTKLNEKQKSILSLYDSAVQTIRPISVGQIVEGKVHSISRKEVIIDIDYKDYVVVENTSVDWKLVKNLKEGDALKVLITEIVHKPSYVIKGSISDLIRLDVESKIKQIYTEKTPITAKVLSRNSAGFILKLDIQGIELDAFMPNTIAAPNKLTDEQSEKLVGKNILVCLETLKEDKGMYVVSRKKYLTYHLLPEEIKKLKKDGTVYVGHVTGTTPFGVFVEFNGCLTGMIHKANLNPEYNIEDLKPGRGIEFYVKDIVKKGQEIILTQVLRESLWDTIKIDDKFKGVVLVTKPFGTLVKLDDETNGLIMTSTLKKSNRKLNDGDVIDVKVVSFIYDERKIYLDFC